MAEDWTIEGIIWWTAAAELMGFWSDGAILVVYWTADSMFSDEIAEVFGGKADVELTIAAYVIGVVFDSNTTVSSDVTVDGKTTGSDLFAVFSTLLLFSETLEFSEVGKGVTDGEGAAERIVAERVAAGLVSTGKSPDVWVGNWFSAVLSKSMRN